MSIGTWLTIGLIVGLVAGRMSPPAGGRVRAELVLGLLASVAGGLFVLYIRSH